MILDKKQAIFNSALDLISKNGFHNSPMSMVAKNANVAAGTIYHYFTSKEELISELFKYQQSHFEQLIAQADDSTRSYKDRFRMVYDAIYDYFDKNRRVYNFIEQYMSSPFLNKNAKDEFEGFFTPMSEFLKKGLHSGHLKSINSKLIVSLFYGNISALMKLSSSGQMLNMYGVREESITACWDSLKK